MIDAPNHRTNQRMTVAVLPFSRTRREGGERAGRCRPCRARMVTLSSLLGSPPLLGRFSHSRRAAPAPADRRAGRRGRRDRPESLAEPAADLRRRGPPHEPARGALAREAARRAAAGRRADRRGRRAHGAAARRAHEEAVAETLHPSRAVRLSRRSPRLYPAAPPRAAPHAPAHAAPLPPSPRRPPPASTAVEGGVAPDITLGAKQRARRAALAAQRRRVAPRRSASRRSAWSKAADRDPMIENRFFFFGSLFWFCVLTQVPESELYRPHPRAARRPPEEAAGRDELQDLHPRQGLYVCVIRRRRRRRARRRRRTVRIHALQRRRARRRTGSLRACDVAAARRARAVVVIRAPPASLIARRRRPPRLVLRRSSIAGLGCLRLEERSLERDRTGRAARRGAVEGYDTVSLAWGGSGGVATKKEDPSRTEDRAASPRK